ncbi:Survival protein SurA precursor (Peptidyl-prolyl cis-trans isomerase SurA) [Minicystis rosea]|nr:Survival protein SurA precursor (Peptidyl-prolyl cis-trans isomerase SurA) [Minicystis rosea]
MNRSYILACALVLAACGGNQPEPAAPAATAAPSAAPAAPAAAGTAAASAGNAAAEACFATANASRARFSGEPVKITAKHVLVKYKGTKKVDEKITRTRAEACLRAIEARDKVRNGDDFDVVVKDYSDEAGAATRNGSIGAVERKDLAKPFADAAFELKPNQLSDVVETEFGFHVILRTE